MNKWERMHREMGFTRPGHLVKNIPNKIGVKYEEGDPILVHDRNDNMCFHIKNQLLLSVRPDEYKLD